MNDMNSRRIHILYIAEYSTGGSIESLLCLVGGLDKTEYAATVLFFAMPDKRVVQRFETAGATVRSLYPAAQKRGRPADNRKRNLQRKVRTMFGRPVERAYESYKYAVHFLRFRYPIYKALRTEILELRPDIVHLNNGIRSDTPGMLAARRCDVPTVCHVRTFSKLTHLNIAAARSVRKFICISNAVRDTIVEYGIDSDRCVVVPNAVDPTTFKRSNKTAAEIRGEFSYSSDDIVFALVGRVVAWKGHEYFIKAIAIARQSNKLIKGIIVGDAEPTESNKAFIESLHSQIAALDIGNSLTFAGHRTDIPDIMRSVDAVVCASSEPEPFGRVIIESMAMGTAVIATDAGGAVDIVKHDITGMLVPIKDSEGLAFAMLRIGSSRRISERLESAATEVVRELYTVDRHVGTVDDIYRVIMKTNQHSP